MAFVGAGRFADAATVIAKFELGAPAGRAGVSNEVMTAEVGLPASRAVIAFAEDRYDDVVETLAPIRRHAADASEARTPNATCSSARCWSRRCGRDATSSPPN